MLPVLIKCLAAHLAASQRNVVGLANKGMDALSRAVDCNLYCKPLVAAAENGNLRVKAAVISKLASLVGSIYDQRPPIITKLVLPFALRNTRESKSEVKNVNNELLRQLAGLLGEEMYDYISKAPSQEQDRIRRIISQC